jgi:hypothetical protein
MMEISSKYLKNYLKKKKLEGSSIITTFFEKSNKKEKTDSNIDPNASYKNIKEVVSVNFSGVVRRKYIIY